MSKHASARRGLTGVLVAGLVATPLAVGLAAAPASADVSTKISTFPYDQDWSDAGLITADDNWSGVAGVQGYTQGGAATGANPQTVLTDTGTTDVVANATVNATNGGVLEVPGSIAVQGSNAATTPYVAFHLDLTGKTGTTFAFNAKDLDGSGDDAVQPIAVQYRIGATGNYTNLADGYIADATTAGAATQVTARSVALPASTDNQGSVFVRVLTVNASGNDELVGIDDIDITTGGGSAALSATDPGDQTFTSGQAITPINLVATGGQTPYNWEVSGLPTGLTATTAGVISGTPTTPGTSTVTATVTDGASATATATFDITVVAAGAVRTIAEIQGTGDSTPLAGTTQTTEGVVTAAYPTGGLNGFYIQTPGADTPNASDALFVYGGTSGFATYPTVGSSVRVTGTPGEFQGQTQITATNAGVTSIAALPGEVTPKAAIPGIDCAEGSCPVLADLAAPREAMESELVRPTVPMTVTDVYDLSPFWPGASFSSLNRGEIGLAADTDPLVTPTELYDAQNEKPQITARTNYNNARRLVLDDGSATNYTSVTNQPMPWLTNAHAVRVGAGVTFPQPVVFTHQFGTYRLLPTSQVVGAPTATQPQFEQTRLTNATPQDVGGDVKLATFNVLNFFPTTGEEFVGSGLGTCTYYTDRAGNRITVNSCTNNGPRGAANNANLVRQRDKIVAAINGSGADIVSLEELENSAQFGKPRDFAIDALVTALNAGAGAGTWAAVPSPPASALPPLSEQDVIRNGFIYKPGAIDLVGESVVLADQSTGTEAFADAREPLAQAFKADGSPDAQAFAVIVNHFKSKGSGTADPDGQGNANDRRVLQANALVTFADQFKTARGISRVFLAGDFNAYTKEDPIQVLNAAGYTQLESTSNPDEESYNFDGQVGSLDHVLANGPALADVEGVDIWEINGNESVYYEYSRFNYNETDLYAPGPFKSSDHNPEIVGIDVAAADSATVVADDRTVIAGRDTTVPVTVTGTGATPTGTVTVTNGATTLGTATLTSGAATVDLDSSGLAEGTYTLTVTYSGDSTYGAATDTFVLTVQEPATREIQILATNDFHGRLLNNQPGAPGQPSSNTAGGPEAGAAVLSGAVKQLRGQNPNTVFAAAGDLIGASTFESFIQNDNPTIDALNEAGLEVSAAGNHEFDQGYEDLVGRVQSRAEWEYIAANIEEPNGRDDLAESWFKDFGDVRVGFVGAVTEDLPTLVAPGGIQGVTVTDIVTASNAEADRLEAAGADVIILLVHEGAPSTNIADATTNPNNFSEIVNGVDTNIDAIVSGHTHLAYNHAVTVPAWVTEGRAVTTRPVVSAGQYGSALNQLTFTVDTATGAVQAKAQALLPLKGPDPDGTGPLAAGNPLYPADPAVTPIVQQAIDQANVLGARVLGQTGGEFNRAKTFNGGATPPTSVENRGGESTLGNLVAEIQRWATRNPESGSAQVAFMNPGGLRGDLVGSVNGAVRDVTFRQAAEVQPFANTLVNMKLTGAQIETALEQQWQPAGASRPFLKLGISRGFTYTYSPPPAGSPAGTKGEVLAMYYNGDLVEDTEVLSVTVNSFLSTGGDAFGAFVSGTEKRDTGKTDLQAQVDYFAEFANVAAGDPPLPVDYSQRAVGVRFPAGAPASYPAGSSVTFDLSSLSMTGRASAAGAPDRVDTSVTVTLGGQTYGPFPVTTTYQTALPGFDEVGTATVTMTLPRNTPVGTSELTIRGNNTGTEVKTPITVAAANPVTTTVNGTAAPVRFGEPATINVTVTPAAGSGTQPTGTVTATKGTFTVTGTLTNGTVALAVPASELSAGNNTFTLAYSGDADHSASTGSVTVAVSSLPTSVTGTATPVEYGDDATVAVTVDATDSDVVPAGTVQLLDGAQVVGTATLTNGQADITVPADRLFAGNNPFSLYFTGGGGFSPSSGSVTVVVTKSVTEVTGTATTITYGQAGEVPVTVTSSGDTTPSGTVTLKNGETVVDTAVLSEGAATFDVDALELPVGVYSMTVEYSGDTASATDTGTVEVTVVKATPTVTATVSPARVEYRDGTTRFRVQVAAAGFTPTGSVNVVLNGVVIGTSTLDGGAATVVVGPWRAAGTYNVQVRYQGDGNTTNADDTVRVVVTKQRPTLTLAGPAQVRAGAQPFVTATVRGVGGAVTGKVRFRYNGKTVVRNLAAGKARIRLAKLPRTTTVTVAYLGTANFAAVTRTKTIRVVR